MVIQLLFEVNGLQMELNIGKKQKDWLTYLGVHLRCRCLLQYFMEFLITKYF